MRIVTGPDGNLQFLPDEIPPAEISTESAPMNVIETEQIPAESETTPESFHILNSYGSLSSEELFQIHFNREMARASAMSDDDLMLCMKELNLIVEIGKIRVRAADKIRIDRLDSKQRTAKEKQKLADTNYKPKRKEQILAEKESAEPKKRKSDAEMLAMGTGMTVEDAQLYLDKKKAEGK